jgi:hypothetical protein
MMIVAVIAWLFVFVPALQTGRLNRAAVKATDNLLSQVDVNSFAKALSAQS